MAISYLLQEDGVSRIILEDGSGFLLLEDGPPSIVSSKRFTYSSFAVSILLALALVTAI